MAQIKKEAVRLAILEAAESLFAEKGYNDATVPQIAARAEVSPSTVYVYFRSKLEIVFLVYGPWLRARLSHLDREIEEIDAPRDKLRLIVSTVWQDLPSSRNGFASNLMQALATATLDSGYDPGLLHWAEALLAGMLMRVAPVPGLTRPQALMTAHIMMMGFDGFALNVRTNPASTCSDALVEVFVNLLLPAGEPAAPTRQAGRAKTRRSSLAKA